MIVKPDPSPNPLKSPSQIQKGKGRIQFFSDRADTKNFKAFKDFVNAMYPLLPYFTLTVCVSVLVSISFCNHRGLHSNQYF